MVLSSLRSFSCIADFPLKLPLPYTFYFYHLFSYKIDSEPLALVFHASFLLYHFLLDIFPFPVFLFFNFSFCLLFGGFSIPYIYLQTLPVLLWAYSYHRGSFLLFVLYKWGFRFRSPLGAVNPRKLKCLWYTSRNTFLRNVLGCKSQQSLAPVVNPP